MKKFLSIILILFSLSLTTMLTSCDQNNSNKEEVIELTEEESEIYNTIVSYLNSFKNLSSVSLVSVSEEMFGRYISIRAQNGFGGYGISVYYLFCGELSGPKDYSYEPDNSINVIAINKKLKKYIEATY